MTRRLRRLVPLTGASAALVLLAGCTAAATEASSTPAPAEAVLPATTDFGVSGEIALVGDGVLQVQDADSQTAVSWTDATTIEVEVSGVLADVTVGSCIVALGSDTATTVAITDPVEGVCGTGAMFGGAGGGPAGMPDGTGMPADGELPDGAEAPDAGQMPDGAAQPGDGASGAPGGGFAAATAGRVVAVSDTTITVEVTDADGTVTNTEISVDDATAYTVTVTADASAFEVGLCVVADGESDDAGGFAATSLTVSDPGESGCTTGFGGGMAPGQAPGTEGDE